MFPASLPSFNSLLVKGPYPPSAPIHLCVSHLRDNAGNALFLSPNRQSLASLLQDFNDKWLNINATKGEYLALLSRIDIYYPPSTAHWLLLLSLFKPLSGSSTSLNKTVLPSSPSLIVLHEPSAYFLSAEGAQSPDLSQYLQLITTALSTASFLSPHQDEAIPLVLFDSRLGDLKLPIIKPVTPSRRLFPRRPESPVRQERVEKFVEKYFEWIGSVVDEYAEEDSPVPGTPPRPGTFEAPLYERKGPFKLRLDRRTALGDDYDSRKNHVTIEWEETKGNRHRHSLIRQTSFILKINEQLEHDRESGKG
ncbi:hypothetical protein ACEPAF_7225 [Sanghuangporus sanghuang]